jgi:hypothetical protein
MINGDDGTSLSDPLGVDFDGGFGERGVDVVDGDRVVGVGSAANQLDLTNWGNAYSHETSTTTASRRLSPASAMNSDVMNLGMGCER